MHDALLSYYVNNHHFPILRFSQQRAAKTGRVVPRHVLIEALEQVPKSVAKLAPHVDYQVELRNDPNAADIELVTAGETWESFCKQWVQ